MTLVRSGYDAKRGERILAALPVVGLTAIAFVVRLAIALRGGLWRDEALFLFVARLPSWAAMLDFLRFHESHPPLFYALMRLWILVFGDTDARSIALPVIFGAALIPAIYFVGRALFSERIGLLGAAFAAVSPPLIEFSATVRPYALMPLLTLISTYAVIRGLQRGGIRVWMTHALSTAALVYTHNWGWLVVVGQWISVIFLLSWTGTKPSKRRLTEWFAAQAAIGIAYLPWISTLIYQTQHAGHSASPVRFLSEPVVAIGYSVPIFFKSTLLANFASPSIGGSPISALFFTLPFGLLAVDRYLRARDSMRGAVNSNDASATASLTYEGRIAIVYLVGVPIAVFVAALILSSLSNLMIRWCLVALAPLLLVDLAYWVDRPRRGAMRVVTRGAVLSLFLTYAVADYQLLVTSRSNARELGAAVELHTRPSDLVIITPEWLASSFNRYFRLPVEQIDYPHLRREEAVDFSGMFDRFTNDSMATEVRERIKAAREQNRRVWLIADREDHFLNSTADIKPYLESRDYGMVAFARTSQLHAQLDTLYRAPDSSIYVAKLPPRYEDIRALLYSPRGDRGH